MSDQGFPFTHVIDVDRLTADGTHLVLTPDADELKRIAEAYGLAGLEGFTADLEVRRWRKSGAFVTGHLTATLEQVCVVTLEAFRAPFDETFERSFVPAAGRVRNEDVFEREIEVDFDAPDPPDEFENNRLDVGSVVCEQFALALDPFPRSPGAELPSEYAPSEDEEEEPAASPFDALRKLKKDGGE